MMISAAECGAVCCAELCKIIAATQSSQLHRGTNTRPQPSVRPAETVRKFCKPGWVNCKINCKAAPHPCLIIGECQVALIIKTCSEIAFLRQVVNSDTFWSNFSVVKNVLTTTAAQLIKMLKFISTTLVNYLLWYSTVVCREGIFSTNFSCSYKEPINYWVDVASLAWVKNIFQQNIFICPSRMWIFSSWDESSESIR